MRIEYAGTQLEQVLKLTETRPIDFVYLEPEEFEEAVREAEEKAILKGYRSGYWFTVERCEIVFYVDQYVKY